MNDAEVSKRVRLFIKDKHCTQKEFAIASGLDYQNLSKYLNGKMRWTERAVDKICRVYGIEYNWLCDGIGEMYKADRRETDVQFAQAQRWLNESEGKSVSVNTIHGDNNSGTQTIGTADTGVVALLKEKIAMLERLLAEKDKQIADKDGYIKMLIGARASNSVVP